MIFKLRRGTIDLGRVVIQMLMSSGHRGQPVACLNIWTGVPQGRGWSPQNCAAFTRPAAAAAPCGRVASTDCLINSGKIPAEQHSSQSSSRSSSRCSSRSSSRSSSRHSSRSSSRCSVSVEASRTAGEAAAPSWTVRRNSSSSSSASSFGFHLMHPSVKAAGGALLHGVTQGF